MSSIRKPIAPPTKVHSDKNKYTRKEKHKKSYEEGLHNK